MAKTSFLRRVIEIIDGFTSVRDTLKDIGMWPMLTALAATVGTYLWARAAGWNPIHQFLAAACVFVLAVVLLLVLWLWTQVRRSALPEDLLRGHLSHLHFRIADLVREDSLIKGRVFEDCTIYGPAILITTGPLSLQGFDSCEFNVPEESVVVETQPGQMFFGAVALSGCIFRRCRFVRIQVAADAAGKQGLMAGFRR